MPMPLNPEESYAPARDPTITKSLIWHNVTGSQPRCYRRRLMTEKKGVLAGGFTRLSAVNMVNSSKSLA